MGPRSLSHDTLSCSCSLTPFSDPVLLDPVLLRT